MFDWSRLHLIDCPINKSISAPKNFRGKKWHKIKQVFSRRVVFPMRRFPDASFSRRVIFPTRRFPDASFSRRFVFPTCHFPGASFSWRVVIVRIIFEAFYFFASSQTFLILSIGLFVKWSFLKQAISATHHFG
jgi:hypothetical protein